MVSSIKEQLETLVALQETELQIRGIEQDLAGIDGRIDALTSEITAYEIRVSEYQTALDELKQQYRADEREVKEIDTHITKSNQKLRDVKTNKEYQSMLKEIDDLKKNSQILKIGCWKTLSG